MNPYLLGGVAVVDSKGVVKWSYVSGIAGDHPGPAEIVAALRARSLY
jgi:hypothetical protein